MGLFASTRYYERPCYSSGQFNTANSIAQRNALFDKTGCWIIDDESFAVAEVAVKRGIANIRAVIESIASDPLQIPALIHTAMEAKRSFDELETACIAAGPYFSWK